jgi:hypothetical protein
MGNQVLNPIVLAILGGVFAAGLVCGAVAAWGIFPCSA